MPDAKKNDKTDIKEVKDYKGKGYGKRLLSKDVQETISQLEEQAAEATEKTKKKSMWGSIGSALGSIGTGLILASNPVGRAATAAAMGAGSYVGSRAGRGLADATEKTSLSKMKQLEGGLMRKSKESQYASFKSTDEKMEKSARKNALMTAAIAGWTTGAGASAGKKLKELGVSDKITQSKAFSKWGGEAGRPAFGKIPQTEAVGTAGEVVKDTTLLESYERGKDAGFVGDYNEWYKHVQDKTQQAVSGAKSATSISSSSPQTVTSVNVGKGQEVAGQSVGGGSFDSPNTFSGQSLQNQFIAEGKGLNPGQSIVDQIKSLASKQEGGYVHSDSSFTSRSGYFEDLGGMTGYKAWLSNRGKV